MSSSHSALSRSTSSVLALVLVFSSLLLFFRERVEALTDYPVVFPFRSVLFGGALKKDSILANYGVAFSFWGQKIHLKQPTLDETTYLTIPKIINYIYTKLLVPQGETKGSIRVSDFDMYFGGEYFFSEAVFACVSIFVRSRDFNGIRSFGFGDMVVNLGFKFVNKPEVYGTAGAVIPLAGEPDEELVTLQRINPSSFGLDLPIYVMLRFPFNRGNTLLSVAASSGYIFRVAYPFFGQIISPGDLLFGSIGVATTFGNFFPTTSDISHNLSLGLFGSVTHGFPEEQRTKIYNIWGRSWNVFRASAILMGAFRRKMEKFGEKEIKNWLNVSLELSLSFPEKSFLAQSHPDYAIIRFPFMDRLKPGFYSSVNLTFIFD